ncbi:MAG: thioredoxin family protein, partial [Alphaproteobacteria bacterium]|nr:thioredoxin family protein [Alphaproteobacteria bacterium]
DAAPTQHAQAIAQYAAMVPRDANADGISASGPDLQIAMAGITQDDKGRQGLVLRFAGPVPDIRDVFIEGVDGVAFKAPRPFNDGPLNDGLFMQAVPEGGAIPAGTELTVTIDAPPQAGSFEVAATRLDRTGSQLVTPLLGIVLIALLGGLVLNLMPCVLPVLALKLSAVIDAAGVGRRQMRLRFMSGAAGIICSFMLLAGGLAAVRIAGGTVGWGIQFQNPVFLVVMMVFIGLFALSLLDRVHIPVPAFAQRIGGGGGYFQDFFTGMLATILATPCSAPFVGTAVAAALSGGMLAHFIIFAAMGAGLAAPWLLVAAFPGAVALLPRPGRWMIWMKRVLALLLFGTVLWLATVLAAALAPSTGQQDQDGSGLSWQMWSPAALEYARAAGIPVFVDVTADWCITCKANKALVLDRDPVASVLSEAAAKGDIMLLQADWTRPDKDIAAFLASHGRYGIPFNIIYSDEVPKGQVLSELLQTSSVMAALETAGISSK